MFVPASAKSNIKTNLPLTVLREEPELPCAQGKWKPIHVKAYKKKKFTRPFVGYSSEYKGTKVESNGQGQSH